MHEDRLTRRQTEILRMIAEEGLTRDEIETRLFISPWTVKDHVTGITRRLGVRNACQAAYWLGRWARNEREGLTAA